MAPKITMTAEELNSLIDSRIAEDRVKQAVEREPAAQPVAVTPIPPGPEPMSDELAGEFRKALDQAKGDVTEATGRMLNRLGVDIYGRPVDPVFFTLFNAWFWAKETAWIPGAWVGLVKNVMANHQRQREKVTSH